MSGSLAMNRLQLSEDEEDEIARKTVEAGTAYVGFVIFQQFLHMIVALQTMANSLRKRAAKRSCMQLFVCASMNERSGRYMRTDEQVSRKRGLSGPESPESSSPLKVRRTSVERRHRRASDALRDVALTALFSELKEVEAASEAIQTVADVKRRLDQRVHSFGETLLEALKLSEQRELADSLQAYMARSAKDPLTALPFSNAAKQLDAAEFRTPQPRRSARLRNQSRESCRSC